MSADSSATAVALPTDKELVLKVIPMPADTNGNGDIFGGWVMAQVDLAGSVVPARYVDGRMATVAVNEFIFKHPVRVGDILSFFAGVTRVGRTSITVQVEVYAETYRSQGRYVKVTEASLTYVAIDEEGRPADPAAAGDSMTPPDTPRSATLEHKALLGLVALFSIAFLLVLLPLAGAVLWAVFIAIVFWPLHLRVQKRLVRDRPSLAALVTLLIIVLIVIFPLTMVSASVVEEASILVQKVRTGELQPAQYLQRVVEALPPWAQGVLQRFGLADVPAMQSRLADLLGRSSQTITAGVLGVGQVTLDFVVAFFIMLYVLYFLIRDGAAISARIALAIPLQPAQTNKLLTQFVTVVRATVKGNIVVALIQGTLGAVAFAVLGVTGPLLWGALMALLSLLPAVGAALVWLPVALYYLFTGQLVAGLGLVAWGVLVIGLVDNVLRPILVGRDTRMPDYLVLVATVGGISLFGLNGFVIGPVIAAMFLVSWNLLTAVRQQESNASSA